MYHLNFDIDNSSLTICARVIYSPRSHSNQMVNYTLFIYQSSSLSNTANYNVKSQAAAATQSKEKIE